MMTGGNKMYKFMRYIRDKNNNIVGCRLYNINTGEQSEVEAKLVKQNIDKVEGLALKSNGSFMQVDDTLNKYVQSCNTLGIKPLTIEKYKDSYIVTDIPSGIKNIQIPDFVTGIRISRMLNNGSGTFKLANIDNQTYLIPYMNKILRTQNEIIKKIDEGNSTDEQKENADKLNKAFNEDQQEILRLISNKLGEAIQSVSISQSMVDTKLNNILNTLQDGELIEQVRDIKRWIDNDGSKLLSITSSNNDTLSRVGVYLDKQDKNNIAFGYNPSAMKGIPFVCDPTMYAFDSEEKWNTLLNDVKNNGEYNLKLFNFDAASELEDMLLSKLKWLNSTRNAFGESFAIDMKKAQEVDANVAIKAIEGLLNTIHVKGGTFSLNGGIIQGLANLTIRIGLLAMYNYLGISIGAILLGEQVGEAVAKSVVSIADKARCKEAVGTIDKMIRESNRSLIGIADEVGTDIVKYVSEECMVTLASGINNTTDVNRYHMSNNKFIKLFNNIEADGYIYVGTVKKRVLHYSSLMRLLDSIVSAYNINQKILDILISAWLVADELIAEIQKRRSLSTGDIAEIRYVIITNSLTIHGINTKGYMEYIIKPFMKQFSSDINNKQLFSRGMYEKLNNNLQSKRW